MTDEAIGVEAIYGAQSRRPLVALTAGPTVVRMTPAHAHRVARHLIGAAGAALADAAAVETLGGERLTGRVEQLAPAAGSEFAVIRPDNASGNFVKVPQRIAVRIRIDPDQAAAARLRPGMSVEAEVELAR